MTESAQAGSEVAQALRSGADERRRTTALSKALHFHMERDADAVVEIARTYEKYLREG